MLQSLFFLLLFYAFGEAVGNYFGLPVPGSVIGLILLVAALRTQLLSSGRVAPAADFLTKNIAFFFVPAGVGIMQYTGLLAAHWIAVLTAAVLSTLLVMALSGLLQQGGEE